MAEVKCKQCGNIFYSKKSSLNDHTAKCPECGKLNMVFSNESKKNQTGGLLFVILMALIIGGLAFGSIALTYFSRKKSWHWLSYIGSLIIACFSIYYVGENWDMEWYTATIIILNLGAIIYALLSLMRKWFKWFVLFVTLLILIISYWPEPEPITYYVESPNGAIHKFTGNPEEESVFITHPNITEVVLRDSPDGVEVNRVGPNQALIIDSLISNMWEDIPNEGWCHVFLYNNSEINGWVYQSDITQSTFAEIKKVNRVAETSFSDSQNFDSQKSKQSDNVNYSESANEELVIKKDFYYKIKDQQGSVNLRDNIDGDIIRQVFDTEKFIILNINNDWCEVFFEDFTTGFINSSSIEIIE